MGLFRWIFGSFLGIWNFNALDNFMVSKLYKVRKPSSSKKVQINPVKKTASPAALKVFERSRCPHLKDYLLSWIPTVSVCCKKKGKEKARARARSLMAKELNMVELLKS